MGGLLVTLQSLLDSLDSIQESKTDSLGGFFYTAAHRGRYGGTGGRGGHQEEEQPRGAPGRWAEFRTRMEVWGLMRHAFSAARVTISKSGLN